MKSVVFWGKVLPERACVRMNRFEVPIATPEREHLLNARLTLDILASQVYVTVEGEWSISTEMLKNSIEGIVRERLDAFGYMTGRGYDVEITGAKDTDGNTVIYGVEIPDLVKADSERQVTIEEVNTALLVRQPYLRHVLADLRLAIRDTGDTAFFCYRAVETIMQFFRNLGTNTLEDKEGWARLRESLRVEKDFINRRIKDAADPRRHGEIRYMSPDERVPQLKAARAIVNRFCIYLNRGCTPLSEKEFPILNS